MHGVAGCEAPAILAQHLPIPSGTLSLLALARCLKTAHDQALSNWQHKKGTSERTKHVHLKLAQLRQRQAMYNLGNPYYCS
eukprot:2787218-Amphidinium_carterae.1